MLYKRPIIYCSSLLISIVYFSSCSPSIASSDNDQKTSPKKEIKKTDTLKVDTVVETITKNKFHYISALLSGVKETRSTKSDYILFPNPTSDYLTIKNELNANSIAKIRLLNSIGIELLNDNMIEFGDKIDLNRFADGWYILEITDTENYISTYKVIKSKK